MRLAPRSGFSWNLRKERFSEGDRGNWKQSREKRERCPIANRRPLLAARLRTAPDPRRRLISHPRCHAISGIAKLFVRFAVASLNCLFPHFPSHLPNRIFLASLVDLARYPFRRGPFFQKRHTGRVPAYCLR